MRSAFITRAALLDRFSTHLEPQRFSDYCPNGLQVEGAARITRLACGVTASVNVIKQAARWGAQALLVHHGLFWKGDDPCVVGQRHQRLSLLMRHELNLYAYHLPLDVHADLGNNTCLGRRLNWRIDERMGPDGLVCIGRPAQSTTAAELAREVGLLLGREPLLLGPAGKRVRKLAWCTGAAQDFLPLAIAAGADLFLSGEVAERTTHLAREAHVAYLAAGHHATETGGVQALAAQVAGETGITWRYFDDPNPV